MGKKIISPMHKLHNYSIIDLEKTGIYAIVSKKTKRIYVGSAGRIGIGRSPGHRGFWARWKDHFNDLSKNKHYNTYLQNHVNKYGIEDLLFVILEKTTPENCNKLEQEWMDVLDSYKNGFNLTTVYPICRGENHYNFVHLDDDIIIEKYANGKTMLGISKEMNIGISLINRVIKSRDFKIKNHLCGLNFNELYDEYINSDYSISEFAKIKNIYTSTIIRNFKKLKLPSKIQRATMDIDKIYNRYLSGESVVKNISKDYRVSHDVIYRLFKKNNLQIYGIK